MNRATRAVVRAKLVLTAIALTAAAVLVVVGSWPFKILVMLAFVRGLFASNVLAMQNRRLTTGARFSAARHASMTTPVDR